MGQASTKNENKSARSISKGIDRKSKHNVLVEQVFTGGGTFVM